MDIITQYGTIFIVIGVIFAFYMTWGIGANDVANVMGTAVGSGAVSIKAAIIIAAICEFGGAVLAGGHVTATIRKGIVDASSITEQPEILVLGMLAALLAAAIWLMLASAKGWPVSTTHSIIGAIVGFAIAAIGVDAVKWGKIGSIVASWIISPLLGGVLAVILFLSIRWLILNTDNPFKNAKRWAPVYVFLVGFIVALVTLFKGLKHLKLDFSMPVTVAMAVAFGVLCAIVGAMLVSKITVDDSADKSFHYASVEKVFVPMMLFTAAAMSFAHGANDVANGIGPLAAVYSIVQSGGQVAAKSATPAWILVMGGVGIIIGLATFGYKVMQTMGTKITELTPSRAFCATMAAAITVVLASRLGLPVSTTHIAVGGVIGVGLARGIGAIDLRVIGGIVTSWVITLPIAGVTAIIVFYMLKGIFL